MTDIAKPKTKSDIKNEPAIPGLFFKNIALGGPGMVAIIRASDLKILFITNRFEEYLGYTNADFEDNDIKFTDLLEPYLHDLLKYQLNVVSGNNAASAGFVIYDLKNKNGQLLPFYLYASPVHDDSDNPVKMYHIVMHPYLSRWSSPFTSYSSKELFLEHFNSEDFGTFEWITDVDKVFWSAGLYQIYEVEETRHEINNLYAMTFVHPNDKGRVKEIIGHAINTGTDLDIEFKIVTAKNNVKIIHCLARTIKNDEGKPTKFVGSIRDVTKQRSIEEDLRNKVEELNHSNKELKEFAYVASHDLQEPLRKITTFGDKLSEKYKDLLTGDGAMYLSRIIASAENMRSLINDLLEFSRISKTDQPFETVNLNVILREVKTDLELTIQDTKTTIKAQPLPTIEAIPSQMKQLFTNIISNGIKFHKPGIAPVITIEAHELPGDEKLHYELDKNTAYYKILITDNGIGFENEYASRIFQVFQRLHGKAEYPGSGIGLAICKKILEYHQGYIYAESLNGDGAAFIFILPQYQKKPKIKKSEEKMP